MCALEFESTPSFNIFLIHLEILASCTGLCGLLYEINSGFATPPVGQWMIALLSLCHRVSTGHMPFSGNDG